jgi:hypothetical protein
MEEIWKDIGIEKYAVSNMGNVRGQDGIRLLKPFGNGGGYMCVNIYNLSIRKPISIHKLVMKTFVGERPVGYEIDHINRNPSDNRLENLRYCSSSENKLNTHRTRTDIEETNSVLRKKIIDKKYREEHRDKLLEYLRNYRQKQKEKRL